MTWSTKANNSIFCHGEKITISLMNVEAVPKSKVKVKPNKYDEINLQAVVEIVEDMEKKRRL